jgi:predicted lipoprotein with Yx(FWY)xxD motif
MTPTRSITFLAGAAVVGVAALTVAACGGGGGGGATASTAPPKTASGQPVTVGVANSGLGKILVDSKGRTLYLFEKDSGTTSACSGACAGTWPPLRANDKPTAGSGATASMLGTSMRSDGKPQVTYNGHPLYRYQSDQKPGDTNGQGLTAFGAAWFALSPTGTQVSGSADGSSSGGSGGY